MPGSPGLQGPPGPPGPPGSVLYLDGGVIVVPGQGRPRFAGYTPQSYHGNLGGLGGANAICEAAFPGSTFCTTSEYSRSEPSANPTIAVWVDPNRTTAGDRVASGNCVSSNAQGAWTTNVAGTSGPTISPAGYYWTGGSCDVPRPLACCFTTPRTVILRGFTAMAYTGDLGGLGGANSKCRLQWPSSFFCTTSDYYRAEPTMNPSAPGVWVDVNRSTSGDRVASGNCVSSAGEGAWKTASAGTTAPVIGPAGYFWTGGSCDVARPLACCENL